MSAVQIAGCSGAGKSAVAAVLTRRGLIAIDADHDPLLARTVDEAGHVVAEADEPEAPDFAWLSQHSWAWDPARLDELIRAAAPATLYVCGGADNQPEVAGRFSRVFLLEIDEPTMLARIDGRQDNDWGHIGDTREYLRRKLPELQGRLRASGAIPIDARQPLDQVADAILAYPMTRPEPSVWDAYVRAVIRIEAPGGVFWVRPGPAGHTTGEYPDPAGRTLHVMTAHNPGGRVAPGLANAAAEARLRTELDRRRLTWWPAAGGDPSWTHVEPGAAVVGLDEAAAVGLAAEFGQDAIFALTPAERRLVGCADHRVVTTGWSSARGRAG